MMAILALFEVITLSVLAIGYLAVDTYGSGLRIGAIAAAEWVVYGIFSWWLNRKLRDEPEDLHHIQDMHALSIDDIIDENDRARIGDESNHAVYTQQLIEKVRAAIKPPEISGEGGNYVSKSHQRGADIR